MVNGPSYKTYNTRETKEEQKKRQEQRRKKLQFFSLLKWATFCIQFFSMLRCALKISKFTVHMDSMGTSLTIPTTSRKYLWKQKSFALRWVRLRRSSWWNYGNAFVWTFSTKRMKMLSIPNGFMLYGKLGVVFFSTPEFLCENMKNRLGLIRAKPSFNVISTDHN